MPFMVGNIRRHLTLGTASNSRSEQLLETDIDISIMCHLKEIH